MQNTFNGKLSAKITQNGLLNAKTLEKQMLLICFIKYCNVLFRLFLLCIIQFLQLSGCCNNFFMDKYSLYLKTRVVYVIIGPLFIEVKI